MTTAFVKGRALLIGVSAYQHVQALPSVVSNDARAVAALLTDPHRCAYDPASVKLLLDNNATLGAMRAALNELSALSKKDESIFFYFSGHGGVVGGGASARTYLLPVDARGSARPDTMLSDVEFSDLLKEIDVRRLFVVLDACHAAGVANLKSPLSDTPPEEFGYVEKSLSMLSSGEGRVVLASCSPSEKSLILPGASNSLFTVHLLDALKGRGQPGGSEVVRVFNLFEYIATNVRNDSANRQSPVFKADMNENFAIAMLDGGPAKAAISDYPAADFDWDALLSVLVTVYPRGPTDQSVWQRAGGDLAALHLGGTGRSDWFAALQLLRNGGGGQSMSCRRLADVAAKDFPNNSALRQLIG